MAHGIPATEFSLRRGSSRERTVRDIAVGRVKGWRDPDTGRWFVDATELEQLAAGSGAVAEVDLGALGR